MKFYKLFLNFNNNIATYKEFVGCLGTGLCNVSRFFLQFLTPFTLEGCNFLIFNLFLTIVSLSDAPRGGV